MLDNDTHHRRKMRMTAEERMDAAMARAEYAAQARAIIAQMLRLRGLRLARDQENKQLRPKKAP